jgi:16S rRNA (uracil1498-N3)-methyltransferase
MTRTHRFFVEETCLRAERVVLDGPVARQMTRVLRLAADDRVTLFCGDGQEHEATIVSAIEQRIELRLTQSRQPEVELRCAIEFGLALLKGEKLEWTVQKLVELGVAGFCFVTTERQVAGGREERWANRMARLTAIAREAVEQCGRVRLPALRGPVPLSDYLRGGAERTLIADPVASAPLEEVLPPGIDSVRILIGPEGGFTPREIELARAGGVIPISLGARALRSETAAIAAAARIAARTG